MIGKGKPHMEIGQKGRNRGKKKPPRRTPQGPLPTQLPDVGGFPEMPKPPPNFLPNTPGYEDTRGKASGELMGAQTAYSIGNQMIPANLGVQTARLGTDRDYQIQALNEQMAGRGIYDSGVRQQLQQRDINLPYGRSIQDLGFNAAGQYADLASQFGGANLGYNSTLYDALMQRANDAYAAQPLGMSVGQYKAQDMPNFTPSYNKTYRGKKRNGNKPKRKPRK